MCLETTRNKILKTRGYHRLPTTIRKSRLKYTDLCDALLLYSGL